MTIATSIANDGTPEIPSKYAGLIKAATVVFLTTGNAFAHKPNFGDSYHSAETAYEIVDEDISIVVYQEVTCEDSELWMTFDVEEGYELYVQLGVPVINRLEQYYPSVAVVAAGLPTNADVPFDLPNGMGAVVFESTDAASDFFEPFTQTESWIWAEEWFTLPVQGKGYVVGWHPEGLPGKIWIATGEVEDFSDVDPTDFIYWNEAVNNFHETGKFERPPTSFDETCDQAEPENTKPSGCASIGSKASAPVYIMIFGLVSLFRRQSEI